MDQEITEVMENAVYDSSVSLHWYDSYCFCGSLYLYYCTDNEAIVRIKRSLKIWRILCMIALYDSSCFCESLYLYYCTD